MTLGRGLRAFAGACCAVTLAWGVAAAEVSLRARIDPNPVSAGESATLEITVDGAAGGVGDPQITLPEGVETLGTSRSQNFTWVNGKSNAQTILRIELGVDRNGTYTIGPIRVRVGSQWYETGGLALTVVGGRPRIGGSARGGPAEMLVDVTPRDPYVGQPVILRVRLIQRAPLAEDPQYTPPSTPGFWAEKSSQPTSYYGDEGGTRVLVTETRTRLYPLAAGTARIGEAVAVLTLSLPGNDMDPFSLFGRVGRRPVQVQSPPVDVRVRALPGGAPAGFDGAVGRFAVTWGADRAQTPKDVPIVVSLDVRGVGNLPLLHTPALATPDAEVFSSTFQDSLGPAGTMAAGRRRFQWSVLPHATGPLRLEAPPLVWLDDASGRYERVALPRVDVTVTAAVGGHESDASGFPAVFGDHPLSAGGHAARPWALAIAGALVGLGSTRVQALRQRARDAGAPAPAWLEGLRHAHGPSFWAAAGRACEALAERGVDVGTWKQAIDAARFGGQGADEERLRRQLLSRLESSRAAANRLGVGAWAAPVVLGIAALAAAFFGLPGGGPAVLAQRGLQADAAARHGDLDGAVTRWKALWNGGARSPALAARLAWAAARRGDLVQASAWVLRGDRGEPRDPSLRWASGQVRDAGGLQGFAPVRVPVRSEEWGLLALLAALGSAWLARPWRWVVLAAAALVAMAPVIDVARASRVQRAIVAAPATLGGEGVDLAIGQVLRVLEIQGRRVRVTAGPDLAGVVDRGALIVEDRGW